ncbi:MAG: DUF4956 domain-containing protein [Bacteroidia bacterium]|jgi:hypothetical protein
MDLLQIANEEVLSASADIFDKLSKKFFIRLAIDLSSVIILIRFIYFQVYKTKDLFFTYIIFNLIIFLISFSLNKAELSMGAAFGLFAVFSMLRYRTEDISIKDMSYLFLSIALGVLNAVTKGGWEELSTISAIILLITWLLESNWLMKKESSKVIFYDQIELIPTENHEQLMADIRLRTGIPVHRVLVQKIDFLRDSAQIRIYYYEK